MGGMPMQGMAAPAEAAAAEAPAEEAEAAPAAKAEKVKAVVTVRLSAFDEKKKIAVIKEVRAITGLGLKESKDFVESLPKVLGKGVEREKAEEMKAKVEAAGGTVALE
jgi:large subunit ribosomal protein L7/L12